MFASLTPASALTGLTQPHIIPPSPFETLDRSLAAPAPGATSTPATSDGRQLLAEMDAADSPSPRSKSRNALSRTEQSTMAAATGLVLEDGADPYQHASVVTADPSRAKVLWAAIRPCWRGDVAQGSTAIRLVLDGAGRVEGMTLLEGRREDASAEAAAQAIVACAPYRIGAAGAFLVRAPA